MRESVWASYDPEQDRLEQGKASYDEDTYGRKMNGRAVISSSDTTILTYRMFCQTWPL